MWTTPYCGCTESYPLGFGIAHVMVRLWTIYAITEAHSPLAMPSLNRWLNSNSWRLKEIIVLFAEIQITQINNNMNNNDNLHRFGFGAGRKRYNSQDQMRKHEYNIDNNLVDLGLRVEMNLRLIQRTWKKHF